MAGPVGRHRSDYEIRVDSLGQVGDVKRVDQPAASPGSLNDSYIPIEQAGQYVGQSVTVEGRVAQVGDIGHMWFINFTENQSGFNAPVFEKSFGRFPEHPSALYLDKIVRISGRVALHKGRPQIVVSSPDQIDVVE